MSDMPAAESAALAKGNRIVLNVTDIGVTEESVVLHKDHDCTRARLELGALLGGLSGEWRLSDWTQYSRDGVYAIVIDADSPEDPASFPFSEMDDHILAVRSYLDTHANAQQVDTDELQSTGRVQGLVARLASIGKGQQGCASLPGLANALAGGTNPADHMRRSVKKPTTTAAPTCQKVVYVLRSRRLAVLQSGRIVRLHEADIDRVRPGVILQIPAGCVTTSISIDCTELPSPIDVAMDTMHGDADGTTDSPPSAEMARDN